MKQVELSRLIDSPIDVAEGAMTAALAREGFGVLTRIDVADVMHTQLGIEHPPMRILGACNPLLAHVALEMDPSVALVLPCNVVLEAAGRATRVTIADPHELMPSPDLTELAREAASRLRAALASIPAKDDLDVARPPAPDVQALPQSRPVQPQGLEVADRDGLSVHRRPVQAVATLSPIYAKSADSLRRVAERLTEEGVGIALIATDDDRPGAVSERDIVRALASGADPDVTRAADVMSESVLVVDANDSLLDAASLLVDRGVRHAPVVEDGRVIGVVSLRDLTGALVDAGMRTPSVDCGVTRDD